jgi:hypothetical protein
MVKAVVFDRSVQGSISCEDNERQHKSIIVFGAIIYYILSAIGSNYYCYSLFYRTKINN